MGTCRPPAEVAPVARQFGPDPGVGRRDVLADRYNFVAALQALPIRRLRAGGRRAPQRLDHPRDQTAARHNLAPAETHRPRHPLAQPATPPPSPSTLIPPTHLTQPRAFPGQLANGGCRTRQGCRKAITLTPNANAPAPSRALIASRFVASGLGQIRTTDIRDKAIPGWRELGSADALVKEIDVAPPRQFHTLTESL